MQSNTIALNSASAFSSVNASTVTNPGLGNAKVPMDMEHIEKTSKDFEAVFISQMVQHMFGDSVGSSAYGSDQTSDVYKSMMMNEYGKLMGSSGGIGIADMVKRELLKSQES